MALRDLMDADDSFQGAVEEALEDWDGVEREEDVLRKALKRAVSVEHAKRLRSHRRSVRGDQDPDFQREASEESGEEQGEPCPECGSSMDCDCDDYDALPPLED